ncbi:MAG: DASS family sodium-coupled anion symporter [Bacteroidota bacterium]|nr:DASS family sodium-coupled anion symporter [Bacteroidota bacterium]
MKQTISAAEEQFEQFRKRSGLIIAPLVFLFIYVIPISILGEQAHSLAALVGFIVVLWLTEALPLYITGLFVPVLLILLGITSAQKAFAPFADPIMFLFIGAFILARAIQLHGLDKRFAYAVLTMKFVGGNPSRMLFAYGAVCCVISMWISNTATTAMMFPIGVAIIHMLQRVEGESAVKEYAAGMMLMCAFASSVGGLATPVGTPTNLIGLGFIERQLGRHIVFFEWMMFAMPIVIVMFLCLFLYLNYFCSLKKDHIEGMKELIAEEKKSLGSLSRAERNTMLAFGITVILWIFPGILAITIGDTHPFTKAYTKQIPESVAALIGAVILFFLPANNEKGEAKEYTMNISRAVEIDWGVLALYGGGITLGQMVFETKLAETLGGQLAGIIPVDGVGLVAISSAIATLTSELTSNVSSANMIVPLVIVLAQHSGFQAAVAATMASSLGFMLPISTPTNAIVYSSGYVSLRTMIRYGLMLDIIGFIIIVGGTMLLVR